MLPERRELVLDYIVERKRMDDLCSSIKDGRFKEQKIFISWHIYERGGGGDKRRAPYWSWSTGLRRRRCAKVANLSYN